DAQIVARSIAHHVLHAAAVHWMHARPHAIHRRVVVAELDLVLVGPERQLLHDTVLWVLDGDAERLGCDADLVFAPGDILPGGVRAQREHRLRKRARGDASILVVAVQYLIDG